MQLKKYLQAGMMAAACALLGGATQVLAETVSYRGGLWYDGEGFSPQHWYSVDGRLTRTRPAKIDREIALEGRYLVPPYAEAHNHNLQNPFLAERFHRQYEEAGIFYALMMCGNPGPDSAAATRKFLAENSALDVLLASACISSSDGHPLRMAITPPSDDHPPTPPEAVYDKSYIVVDSREQVAGKLPLIESGSPDLVKIILVHSEDVGRRNNEKYFGVNGLEPELVSPLVQALHGRGLRVAAHVESAADFRVAVEAGVDIIGHLPGYQIWKDYSVADYRLDDASIRLAAQRGIAVIATAGMAEGRPQAVRDNQVDNLQRLRAAGIPLLMGSDDFSGNVLSEVHYLDGLGVFSARELLSSLVEVTPQALFPGRKIGAFKEGYEASFLALEDNPLEGLQALSAIRMRVKAGREI